MAKNRIAYTAIILMIIIFIGLNDSPAVYTALYAALLMPALSFVFSLFLLSSKKKIHISERLNAAAVKKGENTQYVLTVTNNGVFTFRNIKAVLRKNNRSVEADCKARIFLLPSKENCEIAFELLGKYRGSCIVGVREILFYDPLGLFRFKKKVNGGLTLTVLPETVHLPVLPLMSEGTDAGHDSDGKTRLPEEDRAEINGLREYIQGDGYKRIHWKLSAKKNTLISKTYRIIPENSVTLVFDNSKFPKSNNQCEDKIIEALVSVTSYCAAKDYYVNLRCMGRGNGINSRRFEDLYAAAANIQFDGEERFDKFFTGITENRLDGSNIFIFTREFTDLFCEAAKALLPRHNVVIFYCPPEKRADIKTRIDGLRVSGAVCYILSDKTNIADAVMNCA